MRNPFRSYYPLSSEERLGLWREATIVFDTNALLDLYRYEPETREVFMRVIETQRERVWVPYQVGLEFQNNRLNIVGSIRNAFSKMEKAAGAAQVTLNATIDELQRHPTIEADELRTIVQKMYQEVVHHLDLARSDSSKQMPVSDFDDAIWERLTSALDGRIGPKPTPEDLEAWHKEAQRRIDSSEPPGFKDRDKNVPERYGDYIVWRQILDFAQPSGSIIFVTGDRKEDWWRKHEGRHLGARIELQDEFRSSSSGAIAFYSPDEFLRYARDEFELGDVPERVLSDVEEVGRLEEELARREMSRALGAFEKQIAVAARSINEINQHLNTLGLPTEGPARKMLDRYVIGRRSLDERMRNALSRKAEIERLMDSADTSDPSSSALIDQHRDNSFEIQDLESEFADLESSIDFRIDSDRLDEYRRLSRARDMQWDRVREVERVRMDLQKRIAESKQ